MVQAVLEGVACAIRDSLEAAKALGIPIRSAKLCGGGARSALWQTVMANVLNVTLELPQTEEGPGFGAAMLSMVGCGAYENMRACVNALTRTRAVITPDPVLASRYETQYRAFRRIYPAMKELFHTM